MRSDLAGTPVLPGGRHRSRLPPYWAAFREDLVRNHDLLEAYRARLAEDENETVGLMAKLTRLRLQDIIAAMIAYTRDRP